MAGAAVVVAAAGAVVTSLPRGVGSGALTPGIPRAAAPNGSHLGGALPTPFDGQVRQETHGNV